MRFSLIIVAVFIALLSGNAHAWNDRGHMIVAAVAWEHLSDAAKSRAGQLLKRNPQYATWVNGAAEDDVDEVAFVRAATWPDFIKRGNAGYTDDGDDPSVPCATINTGSDGRFQHKYRHYIDLPFSTDGTPLVQPGSPNAETEIGLFRDTIASETASDDLRSYDLVWLLHLVGEVHQPLYATSRFSQDLPNGDRGGNLVFLCSPTPCFKELHAFWDNVLGTSDSILAAIKAAGMLDQASVSAASVSDPHAWVVESLSIAKTIAEERVALAGARLANLINALRCGESADRRARRLRPYTAATTGRTGRQRSPHGFPGVCVRSICPGVSTLELYPSSPVIAQSRHSFQGGF